MTQLIDDHFLLRYRELLDAEDCAFDELEHASEDGDRTHFDEELALWRDTLAKKMHFLDAVGMSVPVPT